MTCAHCGRGLSRHCRLCRSCPGDHSPTCPRHDDNRPRRRFDR